MHNTRYIITFTFIMTLVSALLLAFLYFGTKDRATLNEKIFTKRTILQTVEKYLDKPVDDFSDEEVLALFESQVEQFAVDMNGNRIESAQIVNSGYKGGLAEDIDMEKEKKKSADEMILPVFVFNADQDKYYVVSVTGSGLWDAIWGKIAIKDDFNTVVGASFDHAGETAGLGAEIKDSPAFTAQFFGKELYNGQGEYVSITVKKGGAKNPDHEVDAITGATVTSDGVTEMLYRGLKNYEPFFDKQKQS